MKTLDIIDIGNNCEGIAKENGKVYFVPKTLVGEKVCAKVIKEKSNFCNCKLAEVKSPSVGRVIPKCEYFDVCGGCQLQHTSYENQLKIKKQTTQNTISKISKLNITLESVLPSNQEFGYRNKMVFAINKDGKICMHDIEGNLFEVKRCHIATDNINKIVTLAQKYIDDYKVQSFDKKVAKTYLRYLVIRELDNKFLITFVISNDNTKPLIKFAEVLKNNDIIFGLFANVNSKNGSLILTEKFMHIDGLKHITSEYKTQSGKAIKYPISPASFMQVNSYIKDQIYAFVEDKLKGFKFVVDAYSGAGLLTAIISQNVEQVVGIEVVEQASKDADRLKQDNNINNMKNINADCVVGLDKVQYKGKSEDFAIVLDPPRKGADQLVLQKVILAKPGKIIYISCNPATLARDLSVLAKFYEIESARAFDMFANTAEIETVVTLNIRGEK